MPAKKPAPKTAKGKKGSSRPAVKKAPVTGKPPVERAKATVARTHKPASTAAKTETHAIHKDAVTTPNTAPEVALPPPVTPPLVPHGTESDDGDGAEPGSLLAGPRNVKPYIAKRGEQYMSKEQSEHFRDILHSWKQDLMVEVDRTVSHMKDEAANFPDPNDRATQEEEFSLELRTRDRERKLIRKIDEALKRLDDGSYGYCLETGEEIGIKRLEARPVATLSLEAQERRERRERQYGDRDDRYR
jgi:DnaK suppressor protein